ncbi:MAG: DUF3164 family protein [Pseudomonadota bacterium]
MTELTPARIPDGIYELEGKLFMKDGRGAYLPLDSVPPRLKLEDETVRRIMGHIIASSEHARRAKLFAFAELDGLDGVLAQEYKVQKRGARRGNGTYTTVDGLFRIKIKVHDHIGYGPEIQIAKELFDACLIEWAADAKQELRAIVTNAFKTDKEGNIDHAALQVLLSVESDDERWLQGQRAIVDSARSVSTSVYLNCQRRETHTDKWETVSTDLAKV